MNIPPLVIVGLSVVSIWMDWMKYRADPYTPFWTYAFRFFTPPMYLIYFYSYVQIQTTLGIYDADAIAPFARMGFLLYLIPNAILLLLTVCRRVWMRLQQRNKVQ